MQNNYAVGNASIFISKAKYVTLKRATEQLILKHLKML